MEGRGGVEDKEEGMEGREDDSIGRREGREMRREMPLKASPWSWTLLSL